MGVVVVQNIAFDTHQVQVTYFDRDSEGPHGLELRTAVIVTAGLDAELAEVNDSVLQLITAWEGLRREVRPSGLPSP